MSMYRNTIHHYVTVVMPVRNDSAYYVNEIVNLLVYCYVTYLKYVVTRCIVRRFLAIHRDTTYCCYV
jgi:hypothetical protein